MSLATKFHNLEIIVRGWTDLARYKVGAWHTRARSGTRVVMLTYPDRPHRTHQLFIIAHRLGISITTDPQAPRDLAIAWTDTTVRTDDAVLRELAHAGTLINADCRDIGKRHLDEVFTRIFGYGTTIDPRTHRGAYVRKSDANAQHDGIILHEPSEPEEGYFYQRLINNHTDDADGSVLDIRLGICGEAFSFALKKYRHVHDRFDNTHHIEIVPVDEVLSADEQSLILRFCRTFGLDYGEIDVLRDADDGRIYIIDVNNTPATPLRGIQMSVHEHDRLIALQTDAFVRAFLPDRAL